MADLATEPRWGRINGTFGEDAQLSGGGPQKEGLDPHFPISKGQVYRGNNFDYHLIPFEAAFRAGTAAIMPYYGIPVDQTSEKIGFGFNKDIITGMLRNKYHFEGVVCTNWGLITDSRVFGFMLLPARARGMEKASVYFRLWIELLDACCYFSPAHGTKGDR